MYIYICIYIYIYYIYIYILPYRYVTPHDAWFLYTTNASSACKFPLLCMSLYINILCYLYKLSDCMSIVIRCFSAIFRWNLWFACLDISMHEQYTRDMLIYYIVLYIIMCHVIPVPSNRSRHPCAYYIIYKDSTYVSVFNICLNQWTHTCISNCM